ncbi:hypothetical protein [Yoonia sp.]|uniref:hypothetical protein n=1 Tax=Yoonia sp. TaxID=2212373 RepID=UPI0025E58C46|nr:hypothetical protein [Yoonia sp.]
MSEQSRRVRRRRVFHIPGFDPIHPRRYRELYRTEGAMQAEISGYQLVVKATPAADTFSWTVDAHIDQHDISTRINVLVWSDIVRGGMAQTIPATYLQLLRTAWLYLRTGTLRRLMRMRKGPVIAALYPVGMLLSQLVIAVIMGAIIGATARDGMLWAIGQSANSVPAAVGGVAVLLKYMLWLVVVVVVLRWFKARDNKLFAYYLMHDYAFSADQCGANPPILEVRLQQFTDQIAAAFNDEVDEVLVVGHSSGAHLAISVLADLIRSGRVPAVGPRLALLTLGQVVPMVSFLPKAGRLRGDLAFLATQDALTWVDVSAPGDGCCFALCDPVAVTGVTPPGKRWPLVMSASFTQSLSPARWRQLRWRFFRLHFQYLCAFDRPKDYDYFQITAGPVLLADRYRDRAASRSRIDVPVSRYTAFDA